MLFIKCLFSYSENLIRIGFISIRNFLPTIKMSMKEYMLVHLRNNNRQESELFKYLEVY